MIARVLELGNYVAPAYAGMVLVEQGLEVEKWTLGNDPVLGLKRGDELWAWLNEGKTLLANRAEDVTQALGAFSIVIDNFRPSAWARWGIDRVAVAQEHQVVWVSLESEVGDTSFDILAQMRAWGDKAPYIPFYIGDTAAGLTLAFKALARLQLQAWGWYPVGHATALAKLAEGELIIDEPRDGLAVPWDTERYAFDAEKGAAVVEYRGRVFEEPPRDRAWQLEHLRHIKGRMKI